MTQKSLSKDVLRDERQWIEMTSFLRFMRRKESWLKVDLQIKEKNKGAFQYLRKQTRDERV